MTYGECKVNCEAFIHTAEMGFLSAWVCIKGEKNWPGSLFGGYHMNMLRRDYVEMD